MQENLKKRLDRRFTLRARAIPHQKIDGLKSNQNSQSKDTTILYDDTDDVMTVKIASRHTKGSIEKVLVDHPVRKLMNKIQR